MREELNTLREEESDLLRQVREGNMELDEISRESGETNNNIVKVCVVVQLFYVLNIFLLMEGAKV